MNPNQTTHGKCGTPEYRAWSDLKQRCYNTNSQDYPRYGGRGIAVCKRWLNSFETFLSDMGEKPDDLTLDRIDNDGDYSAENCRWATSKQQANNRGDSKLMAIVDQITQDLTPGMKLTISGAAKRYNVSYSTAQKGLRVLWRHEFVQRIKLGKRLEYEGVQERLV